MKNLFPFVLSLLVSWASGQGTDFSGTYKGSVNWLTSYLATTMELSQEGDALYAKVKMVPLNGKDSAMAIMEGSVKDSVLKMEPLRFEYKAPSSCLSSWEAKVVNDHGDLRIDGRWKGDLKLTTCPPGIGGSVHLFKINEETVIEVQTKTSDVEKSEPTDDKFYDALKVRLVEQKFYALIIGVEDYADPEIQNLENPIKDAARLKSVLTQGYHFYSENVIHLENPTRDDIIVSLDSLANKVTAKDELLIFFAGHGIWDKTLKQGYWLPTDAQRHSKAHWLSNSTIRDYIAGIPSKHTLLITDACFAGSIFKERGLQGEGAALVGLYNLTSRKAMTSGALTTVPDESIFLEYLIKRLESNTQTLLSADELFRSFRIAVINNSPRGQVPQYGPMMHVGDEGGDFIFLKSDAGK